jgi:deazaflavin-dependent oxidoreductase (nitroreductase family)
LLRNLFQQVSVFLARHSCAGIEIHMPEDLSHLAHESFCYLTTIGRVSGKAHEIEIWFALDGATLYMLAGNHDSDWIKNIRRNPAVRVRIRDRLFTGRGRVLDPGDEATRARMLVGPKYGEWQPGQPRTGWTWESLPVAIDLDTAQ